MLLDMKLRVLVLRCISQIACDKLNHNNKRQIMICIKYMCLYMYLYTYICRYINWVPCMALVWRWSLVMKSVQICVIRIYVCMYIPICLFILQCAYIYKCRDILISVYIIVRYCAYWNPATVYYWTNESELLRKPPKCFAVVNSFVTSIVFTNN